MSGPMEVEDLQLSLQRHQDEHRDLLEKLLELEQACGALRAASTQLEDGLQRSWEVTEEPDVGLREELGALLGCLKESEHETAAMQEQLRCLEKEKEELRTTLQELTTEHLILATQHAQSSQRLERTKEVLTQLQAELTKVKTKGDAALKELHQEKQSAAKLAEALQEQGEIEKVLRKEHKCLCERCESLQWQTAGWKTEQAARLSTSLMKEMVTVKLEEQLVAKRRGISFWLQKQFLLLACMQFVLLCLVLLKRDSISWDLPCRLVSAFGSCSAWLPPF